MAQEVTVDELAQMSQREFTAIREEIKQGFESTARKEDLRILRTDVEAGFQAVTETMKTIVEKLDLVRTDIIEIHDLRARVERLEKKVGLLR